MSTITDAAPAATAPGPRLRTALALATLYVVWSSTYLALRVLVDHAPALLSAGARYIVAGTLLLAVLRLRGAPRPSLRGWLLSAPVGGLMFLVGNGFVALAERTATSGAAAVACGAAPLWAAVLGRWFGQAPSRRELAAAATGLAGVAVLSAGSAGGTPQAMALLALAPVGWSLGSLLSRRLALPPGLMAAATEMITGGSLMMLAGFGTGEHLPQALPWQALAAFAYLVLFGSLMAFSAYTYLLRVERPSVAMSYAYVNPALAVLLGVAFYGEALAPSMLLATSLIVVAVVVTMRRRG